MELSATLAGTSVSGLFSWWLGELKAIFSPLSRFMDRNRPELTLTPVDGQWIVSLKKGKGVRELVRVDFGARPTAGRKAIRSAIKNVKRDEDVTMMLPEGNALRKSLDIPSVAEPDLRRALSFEIDRQTPFKADDVYFDYRIIVRDPATKRLIVELITVPKASVDARLAEVRRWDIHPSRVDIQVGKGSTGLGINLLRGSDKKLGRSYLPAVLSVLLCSLLFAAFLIPLHQLSSLDESLKAQVAREKETADKTLVVRADLAQEVNSAQFLDSIKENTPIVLLSINELTRALPDDTWIMSLQLNQKEIKISGYSTAAAQLISILDDIAIFREPTFTSSIVQDKRQKLERFELTLQVNAVDPRKNE
jgi:general secretion pathway protein L